MLKSLYIHIPFCSKICSYCDFCKMYYNEKLVDSYINSLERELISNYNLDLLNTIYIGGGTPSCLNIEQLNKLFLITNKLNLNSDYEFTMEFNIDDITKEKLQLAHQNKVNRISIGIQTTNNKFFKLLDRYNDKKDILEKINLCNTYFDNINIDLMYGFNNQTLDDLKEDLDFITSLNIKHISIYSLMIEKNTKIYINKIKPISEEIESSMYYFIIDYLKNKGYLQYEISNFSKKGFKSKHNLNYWNNENYYGFGLGASGYIDDFRYSNTRSINEYIKGNFLLEKEYITKNIKMEEELICGLRKTCGISKKRFKEKFNIDIREVFNIDNLIEKKLLCENDNNIYIPSDKLYISNSILLNFILN